MTEPIKPSDVMQIKPDKVVDIFNNLIRKRWDGRNAVISIEEITKTISNELSIAENEVVHSYWGIEQLYEDIGWFVQYKDPTKEQLAHFVFSVDHRGKWK